MQRRWMMGLALLFSVHADAAGFEETLDAAAAQRRAGVYHEALATLTPLLATAQPPAQQARLAAELGAVCQSMRHAHCIDGDNAAGLPAATEALLQQAAEADSLSPALRSASANRLGNWQGQHQRPAAATAAYRQALQLAGTVPDLALAVKLNQAQWLDAAARRQTLTALHADISTLTASATQTQLLLALAAQANAPAVAALPLAYQALQQAADSARRRQDATALAESLGRLADLYQQQGRADDAVRLAEEAISHAQAGQDHALLWPVEQTLGKALHAQGRDAAAIQAYRRAVAHVEAVRTDIPVEYDAQGESDFRKQLLPLYLALSDLLLRQASAAPQASQTLLHATRAVVELAKQTELEDFLGDRCLLQGLRERPPAPSAAHAAVLYPILLADKLVLLLEINGEIRLRSVAVAREQVNQTARAFSTALREIGEPYQADAQTLYRWLIAPIAADLQQGQIDTLITVPDGSLRSVPLAALHDGKQFLLERYALAVAPTLALLHGGARADNGKALLAGLSEPGPVLDNNDRWPGGDGPARRDALLQRYRLSGVAAELHQLGRLGEHTTLLNQQFTAADFARALSHGQHGIVHIASHGFFGHNADDTAIMAYDQLIGVNDLQRWLRHRQTPLQLLTLSACHSVAGDDRLPLGLGGLALRAHARSAVGSLWPVHDHAALPLMTAFYQQLGNGSGTAQALRHAQLTLLHSSQYRHPNFWAAYLLVGDYQ